ncbi:sulfite exporter TauE/SafE family protein [Reinekea blandensis]|uniref:Probable membrane transporter protein n=1 Tax=Reinekea blandensis MED297 TaxID=314283 RepID=A4B9Y2_9GAMM|nr:sulfite exporter TauE/SafE family protein [Reinekea blandensis]EAR11433.1 putative integral membrane protein [Reinekea sp. MED297] [Reinekea blandensis MED297]
MLIVDPLFYFCAIPAVLIFGMAKGGFGGAVSIVSVPLMSLAVSPPVAAAILLPILCVMDLLALKKYWGQWHVLNLKIMIPGALVGIFIGALTFRYLSEAHIRILIGGIALVFALYFWRKQVSGKVSQPSVVKGSFWGTVSGFTSFGIHAGGPPVSVYLLPQKLHPSIYVGTNAVLFAVINYVKLIPYFWLGQLNTANLTTSLVLLPLAPIGIGLGVWAHNRVSSFVFYRVINFFLMLAGGKLLYDGLVQLTTVA